MSRESAIALIASLQSLDVSDLQFVLAAGSALVQTKLNTRTSFAEAVRSKSNKQGEPPKRFKSQKGPAKKKPAKGKAQAGPKQSSSSSDSKAGTKVPTVAQATVSKHRANPLWIKFHDAQKALRSSLKAKGIQKGTTSSDPEVLALSSELALAKGRWFQSLSEGSENTGDPEMDQQGLEGMEAGEEAKASSTSSGALVALSVTGKRDKDRAAIDSFGRKLRKLHFPRSSDTVFEDDV